MKRVASSPQLFEASRAGANSVWRRPERPLSGGPGEHIISGVGSWEATEALARLLDDACALAPRIEGESAARIAGAVAKALGGRIDLESFGLL